MLKEVFRTVPLANWKHGGMGEPQRPPYWHPGDWRWPPQHPGMPLHEWGGAWTNAGFGYYRNPTYVENTQQTYGIACCHTQPKYGSTMGDANPEGATSIYVWTDNATVWWPGWGFGYYRFCGKTGKLIRRILLEGNIGNLINGGMMTARSGQVYTNGSAGLAPMDRGDYAPFLVAEIEELPAPQHGFGWGFSYQTDTGAAGYGTDRFKPPLNGGFGQAFAIDDVNNAFVTISNNMLQVYEWLQPCQRKYYMLLPESAQAICLEDKTRCYILLTNRIVLLFDYERAEVLGIGKLPPPKPYVDADGKTEVEPVYYNMGVTKMTWDPLYRRLLVLEMTPNALNIPGVPDGTCTSYIRGFRFVENADRLTIPIPLKAPRKGRTIPVLVKAVSDRNIGVGGHAVEATVTGDGKLIGIPISDQGGNAFIQVKCGQLETGYPYGYGDYMSGYDYDTGSGGIGGNITVTARVTVVIPEMPITGVPGSTRPGQPPGPIIQDPGAPGDGTTPPDTPPTTDSVETAPNMLYIVNRIYSEVAWNLVETNAMAPNGRGVFVEKCVTAMHDVNARFGHLRKTPGQAGQYNDHSSDEVNYKNPDGITAEVFDIIDPNNRPYWKFINRDGLNLQKWYY